MCSLKMTSCPITSRRGCAPGCAPVASGLTALLTPTLSWANKALVPPVSNRPAATATRSRKRAKPGITRLPMRHPARLSRAPATPRRPIGARSIAPVQLPVMRSNPCLGLPPREMGCGLGPALFAGEDTGSEIGRADGLAESEIPPGLRRIRAEKGAVDRAGDTRLRNAERVFVATGQWRAAADRERRVPVEIADRHRTDLGAEIVGAVEPARGQVRRTGVEHGTDCGAAVGAYPARRHDDGRHAGDPGVDKGAVGAGDTEAASRRAWHLTGPIPPLQVLAGTG